MEFSGFRARFPIDDLHLPNGLAVAITLGLADLAGTDFVAQTHADIMVGNFTGFGLADVERVRLALENSANLSGDGRGLERLAIVLQNLVADGVAGLGA